MSTPCSFFAASKSLLSNKNRTVNVILQCYDVDRVNANFYMIFHEILRVLQQIHCSYDE